MLEYLVIFALAACLSMGLTPLLARVAPKLGILDLPHVLGLHRAPTPRTGGPAIFFAASVAATAALWGLVPLSSSQKAQLLGLLLGAALVAAVGLLDDMRRAAPGVKFSWEVLGALVAIIYGAQAGLVPAIWVALPLTALYLVGGANALNLLDGMDGLAAGAGAVAAFFLGAMAFLQGNVLVMILSVALLGATLGFLPHNHHPAKTFMGDCGSLYLGFLLAAGAALLSNRPYDWIWFLAPLLVLGLPLLDTAGALVRRHRGGHDMFTGDRLHVYDLLMDRGLGYEHTVLVLWLAAIVLGATGLLAASLGGVWALLVSGLVSLAAFWGVLRLGLLASGKPPPVVQRPLVVSSLSHPYGDKLPPTTDYREAS